MTTSETEISVASLADVTSAVIGRRRAARTDHSVLVAITGIDASGKGFVARRLARQLENEGLRIALVGVDPWLNLPARRFGSSEPARHFYEHALRLDELFERLVLPLRAARSIRVEADLAEETATAFHRGRYELDDVDVVVLEGIFLLKPRLRPLYDISVWIDCSFETALERAASRGQEGLSREATVSAYQTIYFPAQGVHAALDTPRTAADVTVVNDTRLGREVAW